MFDGLGHFKVLSRFKHLMCMLLAKSLHFVNSFTLVNDENLVPPSSKLFKFDLVLVLDLQLLSVVLVV